MAEKEIKGFPGYTITDNGEVYHNGKKVKPYNNGSGKHGYLQVKLYRNGLRFTKNVHRLVAEYYGKDDVDHIDGNSTNNNKSNLQILSHKENVKKAYNQN